jgi:hypothetical protein
MGLGLFNMTPGEGMVKLGSTSGPELESQLISNQAMIQLEFAHESEDLLEVVHTH